MGASDSDILCKKFGYRKSFSSVQLKEASSLRSRHSVGRGRKEYRNDLVVTIDGADAKDLDDAVCVKKTAEGYLLYVHVADVSYYVKENLALDLEARRRGNSVYLLDTVIPMLPPRLSNDLCSLNEGVDRLTLSTEIYIDHEGEVVHSSLHEGVIRVVRRCTYDEVQGILDAQAPTDELSTMLALMKDLALLLYKKRVRAGSIDFQFDELIIKLNKKSFPVEIYHRRRPWSCQIIEEFMLTANQVVAEYLAARGHGLFRIHERANPEKIQEFQRILRCLGYHIPHKVHYKQKDLQAILQIISEHSPQVSKQLSLLLLRVFKQAVYSVENKGHFALAFLHYTHFSSPIRRYSDLLVHRLLKHYMGVAKVSKKILNAGFLKEIAVHISSTERLAIDAEREIIKRKSALFMQDKLGMRFKATVSGLTHFGIFVEIEPYGIEGLVRLVDLKERYVFDEEKYVLFSKHSKKYYQLGDSLEVCLVQVNVERNFIDFIIV